MCPVGKIRKVSTTEHRPWNDREQSFGASRAWLHSRFKWPLSRLTLRCENLRRTGLRAHVRLHPCLTWAVTARDSPAGSIHRCP